MISTKNSFSYENISIKFSMYQVHTKSIKVCRISIMIQYKEKEKEKNNILLYYKVSWLSKIEALQYFLKVYKLPV